MKNQKWLTAAAIAAVVMTSSAWATSVRTVNLAEMVGAANRVFRGRCVVVKPSQQQVMGLPVTEYTFQVTEGVKGVKTGQTVVFRQVRTSRGRLPGLKGVPSYRSGEEVLIFLAGDSRAGLTSPIGLGQGVFRLQRDGSGELLAVNSMLNRNLAVNLPASQSQAMGLTRHEHDRLRRGGAMSLASLLSAARRIDRHQRPEGKVK